MKSISSLQAERLKYVPSLSPVFQENGADISVSQHDPLLPTKDRDAVNNQFPHTFGKPIITFQSGKKQEPQPSNVGVIFSGGQASGGHNVIAGLFDGLNYLNKDSKLYGFLNGPDGLLAHNHIELTAEIIAPFRNTGGFDMIGSGRTKLNHNDQYNTVKENCKKLNIKSLVIIGGDDSNTTAGILAEYFLANNIPIQVIGCPKTIDGDLRNEWIETSFGFDTACKVYAELTGSICRDAISAKKYWHIIKLMGRSASHIALECALQTHANITIISEEVENKKLTLHAIIESICSTIIDRSNQGKNYGILLVPEGLVEFIPEIKVLISELNDLMAASDINQEDMANAHDASELEKYGLSQHSAEVYLTLPDEIRLQLVMDRDSHGNVQVSKIDTEKLLIQNVSNRLKDLKKRGSYSGNFSPQGHFFGYEGRCVAPSNFDANYCYNLGYAAAAMIGAGETGYLSAVKNLDQPVSKWQPHGIPISGMMNIERRHGSEKPVIQKYLVDLSGNPYAEFSKNRDDWAENDRYIFPGPIQYFGPASVADACTMTLQLGKKPAIKNTR